jgi:hypothetical protein
MKYGKAYNILEQILSYLSDKLTDSERNDFERELERDPFAAEAMEGFSQLSHEELTHDLKEIDAGINSRSSKFSVWKIGIAATILILAGIFLILYFPNNKPTKIADKKTRTKTTVQPEKKIVKQLESIVLTEIEEDSTELTEDTVELIASNIEKEIVTPKKVIKQEPKVHETIIEESSSETVAVANTPVIEITDQEMDTQDEVALAQNSEPDIQPGTIVESYKVADKTDTSVSISIPAKTEAQKEDIIEEKKASTKQAPVPEKRSDFSDTQAKPKIGEDAFQEYLKKNAILDKNSEYNRKVVRMSIIISELSDTESITIKKSGGKDLDDKAKQLINESSGWYSAIKNGLLVKDTIELKIVFKK